MVKMIGPKAVSEISREEYNSSGMLTQLDRQEGLNFFSINLRT